MTDLWKDIVDARNIDFNFLDELNPIDDLNDEFILNDVSEDVIKKISLSTLNSGLDHGSLLGLSDDDHLQYLLIDGSRSMIGDLDMDNNVINNVGYVTFDLNFTDGSAEGRLQWNADEGALEVGMPGGVVNLQIGQEQLIRARNDSGSVIINGSVIYIDGSLGVRPTIQLADANNLSTSKVMGIATENIDNNSFGYVTTFGLVRNINTIGCNPGDILYLSSTPGTFSNVRPEQPIVSVTVGICIVEHASDGVLLCTINIVPRLIDLSDVYIPSIPNNTESIQWDSGNERWEIIDLATRYLKLDCSNDPLTGDLIVNNTLTALALPAFAQGSIPFVGASGILSQNNDNLFWDDNNNRLGIGTSTPVGTLDVGGKGVPLGTSTFKLFVGDFDRATNYFSQIGIISRASSGNGVAGVLSVHQPNLNNEGQERIAQITFRTGTTVDDGEIHFGTVKSGIFRLTDFIIDEIGNIGIGTNNPGQKLEVNGISLMKNKIAFTQIDLNEYIDSLNDGYMDYGATVGHRFMGPRVTVQGDLYVGNNADVDPVIVFDGNTSDGQLYYDEDNGRFNLSHGLTIEDVSSLLSAPIAGTFEYNDGRMYITNISTQRAIDRTSCVKIDTTTIANTTVETEIYNCPMEANSLVAGNVFKIIVIGIASNVSASDILTIRVKVGGVTIVTITNSVRIFSNEDLHIDAIATQRTIGGSGSRAIHFDLGIGGDSASINGIAVIDTTANMDISITAQWNNAKAGNSISVYQGIMEYKN